MIEIQLEELDLQLEVAELPDHLLTLDETGDLPLQGPIDFGALELDNPIVGLIDLDLLGFPYHGLSAYQIALKNGFVGTEAEWLASLKGEPGDLSPEGQSAVNRAISEANRAGGFAQAAAGYEFSAYTYSGEAGVHAQSALSAYTNAVAARDETGQIASAMTLIRQESEAMLTDTREMATATIQERVKAETARAAAELARDRAAQAETTANASSASASDSATMAVNARNQADDKAAAALLSESNARTYADESRVDAEASNQAKVIATAARDEAKITAEGVIIEVDKAAAHASDSEAYANASRDERIAAQAARDDAGQHANASLQHSQTAEARANDAGDYASAADQRRIQAEGAAGRAEAAEQRTAISESNANGSKVAAEAAEQLAVQHRNQAGNSAQAAADRKAEVEVLADAAGQIQSALSQRVDSVTARVDDAEGEIETFSEVAITARDKVNATTGVNLNVNGYVTGWKSSNDGTTGTMTIVGNIFRLVDPNGGTPVTPFEVIGSMVYFNANVRINGNLIVTGTINTPAIAEAAVTGHVAAYNDGTVVLTNNIAKRVHGVYLNVATATSPIKIDFNCWASFIHNAGGSFIAYAQLVRSRGDSGGTVLCTVPIYGSGMANDTWQGAIPIKYLDKPGETGNWHYYVQFFFNVNNMTTQSITARYIELTELKNNPSTSITEGTGSGAGTGYDAGSGGGGGGSGGDGGGGVIDPGGPGGGGSIEEPTLPSSP